MQNPAFLSLDLQRFDMPTDATGDGFGVIVVDQFLNHYQVVHRYACFLHTLGRFESCLRPRSSNVVNLPDR